jgi:DNA-binding NtrC family response regulator
VAVFVVDDDPLICAVVSMVLARKGRAALTYPDADTAMAALDHASDPVELLITDVSMPGELDGIALAAIVAKRRPGIPIVLMSGSAGSLTRGGELSGVLSTLAKPFTLEQLDQALALVGLA